MIKINKKFILKPNINLNNINLTRPRLIDESGRDKKKFWLDKNENLDNKLNLTLSKIFKKLNPVILSQYPDSGFVHKKLSKLLKIKDDNLIFTNGSDGAIKALFAAFVDKNDTVLHTNPTFAMYPIYSKIYGAKAIKINYKRDSSTKEPFLDFENIKKLINKYKPKLFCLPNPDSPTGTVLAKIQLKEILDLCLKTNTIVLIDEAYYPYFNFTVINLINKYENLIVARTFSKAWGLAGLRIGYAAAHKNIINYLNKAKPMYEVGNYQLHFINLALDNYNAVQQSVKRLNKNKLIFKEAMLKLNFPVLDTKANFIHVDFGNKKNSILNNIKSKFLFKENIDHRCLYGFSRFTIGSETVMKNLINNIKKSL